MRYAPLLLILSFLTSCAGYQINNYSNPLKKYGIESLKVMSFYNESTFQGAGSHYTSQAFTALSEFTGLKLSKSNDNIDGVLLGVVSSNRFKDLSQRSTSKSVVDIAGRQRFQVTATNQVTLSVDYYLIKDKELKSFNLVRNVKSSQNIEDAVLRSKSLFHKRITLSAQVRRERFLSSGSKVNYTQNQSAIRRKIIELAKRAAYQLRDELLHEADEL